MEILTGTLIVALAIILCTIIFQKYVKNRSIYHYPTGPMPIPFLGNFLSMAINPHLKLSHWAKKYGALSTIYFGTRPALLVSDLSILRELLSKYHSTGKFKTDSLLLVSRGSNGVFNTDGKISAELRVFCAKSLKSLGFGTKAFEEIILTEARSTVNYFSAQVSDTGTILPYKQFQRAISNTIWSFVGGQRLQNVQNPENGNKTSEILLQLQDTFVDWLQYSIKTGLCFCGWLKYIAPNLSGYNGLDKACDEFHQFFENLFVQTRKTFVGGSEPRHLVDCYLEHLHGVEHPKNSVFYGYWGFTNSVATVSEIFIGGVGTTAITMDWITRCLSLNLEVQSKLRNEILEIIGCEREPSVDDKPRMPYTEAVLLEAHRYSSVLPLGVFHELVEDLEFHGHYLPKGMIIVPNLYHIHHDKEVWGDPENFRPERFLEKGGSALKENVVPFQVGRRMCLGEALAKDFIFLMVTSIFQKFGVKADSQISRAKYLKPDVGFALMPQQINLFVENNTK